MAWPGFTLEELDVHVENGEQWRSLRVTFPDDVPTHRKEQTLYFDDAGLVRRHDYITDLAGGVASHYPFDHQKFRGFTFPTRHRVVLRTWDGPLLAGPSAVFLDISDIRIRSSANGP